MKFYRFARAVVKIIFRALFRVETVGRENVPKEGGALIAVNHRSNWDVIAVGTTSGRLLRYMAKSEMFENKILNRFFSSLGAFPVHRGRGDVGAIKTALTILQKQHIMLMFPEGKRVHTNERTEAKAGVAMIATRAKVPVVPVHIIGEYKFLSKIKIIYGKPITFDEYYDKKVTIDELQELSNGVLDTIYSLGV